MDLDFPCLVVILSGLSPCFFWTERKTRFEVRRMVAVATALQDANDPVNRTRWLDRKAATLKNRKRRYNQFKRTIMACAAVEAPLHVYANINTEGERIHTNRESQLPTFQSSTLG